MGSVTTHQMTKISKLYVKYFWTKMGILQPLPERYKCIEKRHQFHVIGWMKLINCVLNFIWTLCSLLRVLNCSHPLLLCFIVEQRVLFYLARQLGIQFLIKDALSDKRYCPVKLNVANWMLLLVEQQQQIKPKWHWALSLSDFLTFTSWSNRCILLLAPTSLYVYLHPSAGSGYEGWEPLLLLFKSSFMEHNSVNYPQVKPEEFCLLLVYLGKTALWANSQLFQLCCFLHLQYSPSSCFLTPSKTLKPSKPDKATSTNLFPVY